MNLQSVSIDKFSRTPHLEGSRLQIGDEGHDQIPYRHLEGYQIIVEEKLDGANSGIRFSKNAELLLQSRGHYLVGGGREKHFNLFKTWASAQEERLYELLEDRFLMYGEWMYAKHTVFYDQLPHLFQEFDILDTYKNVFLSTFERQKMLAGTPVVSVPVLYEGPAPKKLKDLLDLVKPSWGKTYDWKESLKNEALKQNLDPEKIQNETEKSDFSEGLYIKVEKNGEVIQRLKWVRRDFLQTMTDNNTHWLSRPIVPNQLAPGVDIYAPTPRVQWSDLTPLFKKTPKPKL